MLQISGREGWFLTNPSLLVQYLASFFYSFTSLPSISRGSAAIFSLSVK